MLQTGNLAHAQQARGGAALASSYQSDMPTPPSTNIATAINMLAQQAGNLTSLEQQLQGIVDYFYGSSPVCNEKTAPVPEPYTPLGKIEMVSDFIDTKTKEISHHIDRINVALGR